MSNRQTTRLIREGQYAADVEVELIEEEGGWSPYLTPETAYKLDDVRDALKKDDLATASRLARVFRLTPVETGT